MIRYGPVSWRAAQRGHHRSATAHRREPLPLPRSGQGAIHRMVTAQGGIERKLPKGIPHWTMQDLRRTARKLMTRARIRPDVAELALGHSIKGIQAVYDDLAEYQPMIDHAFEYVANEIEKIINPHGFDRHPITLDHVLIFLEHLRADLTVPNKSDRGRIHSAAAVEQQLRHAPSGQSPAAIDQASSQRAGIG